MNRSSSDRMVAYLVALTAAVLVVLFGLDRFGIWQPHEIRVAELARELNATGAVSLDRPPAAIRAVAMGFRLGRATELWGRLPGALLALAALGSLMAAARNLGDRRLSAYAGIAYATLPLVFMNARQMFGGGLAQSAATLALSGLALAVWGRGATWRSAGAVIGALGLALGVPSAGVLLGVIPVLGGVGLALLLRASGEPARNRVLGVAFVAVGGALAARAFMVASQPLTGYSHWVGASNVNSGSTQWQTFELYLETLAHGAFPWTGLLPFALVRLVAPPSQTPAGETDLVLDDEELKEVDPWREAGIRLSAFVAIALGFAVQTFHMQVYGVSAFIVVAPMALGLAVLLRDAERELIPWRTVGLGATLLTALMLRDFLQFPKSAYAALGLPDGGPAFPSGFAMKLSEWNDNWRQARLAGGERPPLPAEGFHFINTLIFVAFGALVFFQGAGRVGSFRWDAPWTWLVAVETEGAAACADERKELGRASLGSWLLSNLRYLFAVLAVVCVVLGLSLPGAIPGLTTPGRSALHALAALPVIAVAGIFGFVALWNAYAWVGGRENPVNRVLGSRIAWVPLAAVVVALINTQGFMTALSEHMSPRGVWQVVRTLRHGDEPVARYGGAGEDPTSRYYISGVTPELLQGEESAISFLTGSQRSFLVVASDVFPSLNRAFRRVRHTNLPVVDATNSNLLLAVSSLDGQPSRNPLDPYVMSTRPNMRHPAPEPTRWEDNFEYIGYDLDSRGLPYVPLGGSFKITFNFHVLRESPRNWQIFIHTDGQGPRLNGDHEPVGGKYPVRYWLPGDYIRDQYTISIPATYRAGIYTVYMGFFEGGDRMRLDGGNHDRDNRVVVARINVR
ncbi:MAG: hypothetical protein U0325_24515 [Polyangiales bacterium]